ncbi:MAG: hypothetical protein K2Q24_10565 [Chitinophagaceae bacterium]|jgi:hypothetical protein|nr:hypothetical protein [Chitinophagaceae bacterium]
MKHISILSSLFLLIISSGTNCKKNNPESGLPPATQEGKNTAGFLVNGKVWLPRGDNGFSNLSCYYDETFMGGAFTLNGYRYDEGANNSISFVVASDSIQSAGIYKLNIRKLRTRFGEYCNKVTLCCYQWTDTIPNHNAFLNITKLDKQKRIVSGTFEFALTLQNCETVRITQGRFDMKF